MESAGHRLLGRDAAVAALVVLVVLLVQLPARLCGVNLLDEGAILQTADDLRRGLRLYVDAVHLPFPGIFYLTAWAFALGGTSMSTARTLAALVFAAAALARQAPGFAVAGALARALLVCRPAPGRRGASAGFAGGAAGVAILVALCISASGMAREFVRQTIIGPLVVLQRFAYLGRPAFWPPLRQDPGLRANAWSYFPPVLYDLYWPQISASRLYRQTAIVDAALKLLYHLPWIVFLLAGLTLLMRLRRTGLGAF